MSEAFLQIHEIERLAKAGVKIEMTQIFPTPDQVVAEPWPAHNQARVYPLIDAFWERWRRANGDSFMSRSGQEAGFGLYAATVGDKVQVFVHSTDRCVLIEDEAPLYPSDALMAKLHLWERSK